MSTTRQAPQEPPTTALIAKRRRRNSGLTINRRPDRPHKGAWRDAAVPRPYLPVGQASEVGKHAGIEGYCKSPLALAPGLRPIIEKVREMTLGPTVIDETGTVHAADQSTKIADRTDLSQEPEPPGRQRFAWNDAGRRYNQTLPRER